MTFFERIDFKFEVLKVRFLYLNNKIKLDKENWIGIKNFLKTLSKPLISSLAVKIKVKLDELLKDPSDNRPFCSAIWIVG